MFLCCRPPLVINLERISSYRGVSIQHLALASVLRFEGQQD